MVNSFSDTEKKIMAKVQGDIPLSATPFTDIAQQIESTEVELIAAIANLQERGIIKKFGAILRHQKAGYKNNAMVVWAIATERVKTIGKHFANMKEISHCYERTPVFEGRFNVFTMIHLKDGNIAEFVKDLADALEIDEYQILKSEKEFKKISREYFQ